MSKGTLIILNLMVDHWMEIGDHGKVFEEHVKNGAVALLVPLVPHAHATIGGVEAQDKVHEHEIPFSHPAVVSSLVLKLGGLSVGDFSRWTFLVLMGCGISAGGWIVFWMESLASGRRFAMV